MSMIRAVNTIGRLGIMPVAVTPMTSAFIRSHHSAISVGLPRTLNHLTISPAIATAQGTAAFTTHETQRDIGTKPDIAANVKEDDSRPGDNHNTHFRLTPTKHPLGLKSKEWSMPHGIWTDDELKNIKVTHKEPGQVADYLALGAVRFLRFSFDLLAGFKTGTVDEHKYLNRVIFLETVAGIPGMVAGALRHLQSLRRMRRDHGWIHTLLEEAENERMHLLTFLKLKKPGPIFRFMVFVSQGVMWNAFFLTYLISPKTCHRFVGYIEEEAVHTYTTLLNDLDNNKLPLFSNLPAPSVAKAYWKLPEDAMFRDLILAVRADEANHRLVNHTFADMHKEFKQDAVNPFNIQAKVTEYAKHGGTVAPTMANIVSGEADPALKEKEADKKKEIV